LTWMIATRTELRRTLKAQIPKARIPKARIPKARIPLHIRGGDNPSQRPPVRACSATN
jgi:hypothetical protein